MDAKRGNEKSSALLFNPLAKETADIKQGHLVPEMAEQYKCCLHFQK